MQPKSLYRSEETCVVFSIEEEAARKKEGWGEHAPVSVAVRPPLAAPLAVPLAPREAPKAVPVADDSKGHGITKKV